MKRLVLALSLLCFSHEALAQSFFETIKNSLFEKQLTIAEKMERDLNRGFGEQKISAAFQDTLYIGSHLTLSQVSAPGGYNLDKEIHIPLPRELLHMFFMLDRAGLSGILMQLEHKLNRSAEQTITQAQEIFSRAITQINFEEAEQILKGNPDAATIYLKETIGNVLESEMLPLTNAMMRKNGTLKLYENFLEQYEQYDVFPKLTTNIVEHTNRKALDGIFYYLARHEIDIRQNPGRWATDNMKTVFGS